GSRAYFGALHVGVYEGGRLVYASKVGGGFNEAALAGIWAALQPLARPTSPFDEGKPTGRGHHWVEPKLVCEVRFTEGREDGGLGHPVFVSLRTDKRPEECRREAPGEATVAAAPEHAPAAVEPAPAVPKRARAAPERAAAPRERASATPEGRTAAPSAR